MSDRLPNRPPSYLTCASLARELEVSERTIYDMVKRGVLPQPLRFSSGCVRWKWDQVCLALDTLSPSASAEMAEDPFMKGVSNVSAAQQ